MGPSCGKVCGHFPRKITPDPIYDCSEQQTTLIHLRSILDIHQRYTEKELNTLDSLLSRAEVVYGVLEARYAGKKDDIFIAFVLDDCLRDLSLRGVKLEKAAILSIIDSFRKSKLANLCN